MAYSANRVAYTVYPINVNKEFPIARWIVFIAIHIPLAFLFRINAWFPTFHALVVLAIGLFIVMRDSQPDRLVPLLCYITGAELLWRATGANIFWEYAKYATSLLAAIALLKYRLLPKATKWPIIYFLLLTPSIFVLPEFDREAITFALAGPLALALACIFFSTVSITQRDLKGIFLAILAPVVGFGAIASFTTFTAESITFAGTSNALASGGFGPNQVSSMLGLGAMLAFFLAVVEKQPVLLRLFWLGLSLWLFGLTLLTFSRGGFWTAIIATLTAGLHLLQNRKARVAFIFAGLLLALFGYWVVFPVLDQFTGNALQARLSDPSTTGRLEIIQADILVFESYPILGVGPKQSEPFHALTFRLAGSHTEYSRLLAEHGLFGLIALIILASVSLRRLFMNLDPWLKAFMLAFTVWALLFMFHAATRMVAPSLMFGLGSATFLSNRNLDYE